MYGEKVWQKLHKNAANNIEQILEATPHKIAAIGPPTTHHKNYPRRIRYVGHCWRSKDKLISKILLWTPLHVWAKVGRPARTYKQLCASTGYSLEDFSGAMDNRQVLREGQGDPQLAAWHEDALFFQIVQPKFWVGACYQWDLCNFLFLNRLIGLVGRVRETRVQSQVESCRRLKKRCYFIPPCFTLGIIRYVSRVKWSGPRKGVVPSSTPQCGSYWKWSLRVALNYSCQLY